MISSFWIFALPYILFGLFSTDQNLKRSIELKKRNAVSCSSPYSFSEDSIANEKFVGPLPGWGNYSRKISTKNDSAQFYFNQGLNMYYSYHMREAFASFKEAARHDSACSMAFWGQALTLGPNYNFASHYKMPKIIYGVLDKMNQYKPDASPLEQSLIEAMSSRYSSDSTDKNRNALNEDYAKILHDLIGKYANDEDVKMLYIDAMMLIHAWDFWNTDGTPKDWTPELVKICESVLKVNGNHPAALHYYIHLTEASHNPQVALASADKLYLLLPGVAHMVHMSSHEYERNGIYAKGVEVNDLADDALGKYDSLARQLDLWPHVPHYLAVEAYCALSGGMYQKAMKSALQNRELTNLEAGDFDGQLLYMYPSLIQVRLGKWDEILKDTIHINNQLTYASILFEFARGMACTRKGYIKEAQNHLNNLNNHLEDPALKSPNLPQSPVELPARVSAGILRASILYAQNKKEKAIESLKATIAVEDQILYTEPKDWMIPARQYLGDFYMKMGKADLAEKTYKDDLVTNPGNGWSLLGLYQSLTAQNKTEGTDEIKAAYLKSFSQADQIPPASVY